jgi:hypothetical protein
VGNILLIVYETGKTNDITVYVWGLILSQLGFYPLLTACLQFIRKWFDPLKLTLIYRILIWQREDPSLGNHLQFVRVMNLPLMAALVLSIISGVWTSPGDKNINEGYDLRRAGDIIFAVCVLIIAAFSILLFSKSRSKEQRFDLILLQIIIISPILLIRIIYACVQAFLSTPSNPGHNTWVYFGLLLIPDFITVTILTACGFLIKPFKQTNWQPEPDSTKEVGLTGMSSQDGGPANYQNPAYQEVDPQPQAGYQRPSRRQRRLRGGPIMMLIGLIVSMFDRDGEQQPPRRP